MQFSKAGIILLTRSYQDCVTFYGEVLGLPLMFRLDRAAPTPDHGLSNPGTSRDAVRYPQ